MPSVIPFILISVALAIVASYQATRLRAARTPRDAVAEQRSTQPIPTRVLFGRVGDRALTDPVRAVIRVAPEDRPDIALEIVREDGTEIKALTPAQLVMARAWSGGRLWVAIGKPRPAYGPAWPLGPNLAGWELHVVTTAGETLRCYGAPGTALDAELTRLHPRIRRIRLPRAS